MPLKYGHGQHSGWPPHSVDPIQDTLLPGNHGNQHPKLSLTVLSTKAVRTSLKPVATRTASVKSGLTNLSNMADGSHICSTFVTLQDCKCTCGKPGCRTFWEAACEELPPAKGFFSPGKKTEKRWMRFQCFLLGSLACLQLAELGICTWVFQVHQKTVQDLLRSWVHFQRIPRDHWNKPEKKTNVGTSQQKLSAPSACWGKRSEALQYNLPLTRNLPASSHFCYQIPRVENFDLQSQCWQARLCRCSKQQAHTINLGEKHMVQSYETKDPCIVKTRDPHRRWFTTRFFENNTVDHVIIQVQIRCQTRLKALS